MSRFSQWMRGLARSLDSQHSNQRRYRPAFETLEDRLVPGATIGVDATANVHVINPLIYGAAFASTAQLSDLNLTINRDGGNASDTYNWQQDASNHASDWYYESIANGSGNGQGMDSFVNSTKAGGAQADLTVDIMPYAASLGPNRSNLGSYPVSVYGAQQSTDPWNSNFGNGVTSGGKNILDTNPLYNYVANSPALQQSWIQHLISTFGNSSSGGVQYFTLGNEPGLWNSTHRDIHPNGETNTELLNDFINYAGMIKSIDPGAKILGPEEWGWTNYFIDGADAAASNWGATYNGLNVQQWLLQQLQAYQTQHGTRLLDYFTLHYYPQDGSYGNATDQATELIRNQSTRSLWDPNYVDQSWIASTGINGGKVDLIPMMQNWVNTYYPGTKVGITEYNWGAEGDMNGATTQTDIYGIFGRQNLDLGTRWTTPATGSPTYLAMKLWRNYDGLDSGFGDTSVSASVGNPDQTDAFAATRSSDGALTVAVINKNLYSSSNPTATTSITINLSGFNSNGVAQEWQLAAINGSDQTKAAITHLSDIHFSGNTITLTVPMESVTMFVIEPASVSVPATPTGVTATAGSGQVALSWNAVVSALSYNIFRATTAGGEGTTVYKNVTITSFTDTGLANGTTYYYRVSAVNSAGQSAQSSEVSAMPQVAPPAPPTGLAATAGNAQLALSWNTSSGATSYNIFRATTAGSEGSTVYQNVTNTSFTDTGLTNGTTYYYQVSAVDAGGQSSKSGEVSAKPLAPVSIAIDAGGGAAGSYLADMDFSGGSTNKTKHAIDTSAVANPAPQAVYQSSRNGNFTYTVSGLQTGGSYAVRLHFAENSVNAAGQRVFNVAINGTQVLTNFDVFAAAGAEYKAIMRQFIATADNTGAITIKFTSVVGSARVNGIQVLPAATAYQAVDAGGGSASPFAADSGFTGGSTASTTATISTGSVSNPAPQTVYQTERYGNFSYLASGLLPGASYTVRLHFAEIYWTSAGQRIFNVTSNGTQVLTNFDIVAAAGGANIAIVETFTATADSSGNITIGFLSVVNFAKLSGIEISLR